MFLFFFVTDYQIVSKVYKTMKHVPYICYSTYVYRNSYVYIQEQNIGIKIYASVHPWHFPEPLGIWVQRFLPDSGTVPFCNDWNTDRISLSTVVRNSLVASTCLALMKIKKSASKITPKTTCFFITTLLSLWTKEGKKSPLTKKKEGRKEKSTCKVYDFFFFCLRFVLHLDT